MVARSPARRRRRDPRRSRASARNRGPGDRRSELRSSRGRASASRARVGTRSRFPTPRRRPARRDRRPPRTARRRRGWAGRASCRRRAPCSRCCRPSGAAAPSSARPVPAGGMPITPRNGASGRGGPSCHRCRRATTRTFDVRPGCAPSRAASPPRCARRASVRHARPAADRAVEHKPGASVVQARRPCPANQPALGTLKVHGFAAGRSTRGHSPGPDRPARASRIDASTGPSRTRRPIREPSSPRGSTATPPARRRARRDLGRDVRRGAALRVPDSDREQSARGRAPDEREHRGAKASASSGSARYAASLTTGRGGLAHFIASPVAASRSQ